MSMTVTEKEHFQRRLFERAHELHDEILEADHKWQRELAGQAVALAEEHYDIKARLEELDHERKILATASENISRIKDEITAHMRGLKPEHVSGAAKNDNSYYRYSNNNDPVMLPDPFTDEDFKKYPTNGRRILRGHAEFLFKQLLKSHPEGQRLVKLREQYQDFKDRLVGVSNHTQLAQVWQDVAAAFTIIMEETKERQLRKIDTTRSEAAKPAKAKKAKK
jgi:hypothetical protein